MPAESPGRSTAGILIALDTLIVQRADLPSATDEAPIALRRIGWMGRPIILAGSRVAGRSLPVEPAEREAWVRASMGSGAYAVVQFDDPSEDRAARQDGEAVAAWRRVSDAHRGSWLLTDRPRQVGPARDAGLKVILIGPSDPQPLRYRPDYRARDLRDAVGHLLTMDVFGGPGREARIARPLDEHGHRA